MNDFTKLLNEFNTLPKTKHELTLLQIAGYPHYENVCSNILSFYLDPEEEHGLGDLLLKSILNLIAAKEDSFAPISTANVHREWSTDDNKRIDVVVEFPSGILSIENKIFHHLHNDEGSSGAAVIGQRSIVTGPAQ